MAAMILLTCATETAAGLPALWLIATGQSPGNLAERSALRRATAQAIVASQLGLPPQAVLIGHDPRGRPILERPAGTGMHLSLATRSGLVAVALARGPVGVDVERIDSGSAPPLAVLHPRERAAMLALPEPSRPLAFARIWCAKEAYVKALGLGFMRAPERFAVALKGTGGFSVHDPERPGSVSGTGHVIENGGQESLAAAMIVLD
jgi:phosphopantetheinyl transferase